MLGKVVSDSQRDWDEVLPQVMAAYRSTRHDATGYSHNMLFLGREVTTPLDLIMDLPSDQSSDCEDYDDFVQRVQHRVTGAYQIAREHLRKNAERRKSCYDIRVREQKFQVGDWVWYYYPRRYRRKSPKWQKHYTGPFLVVRVTLPSNYVLQRSLRSKPFVVHADKLKKCYGDTPVSWLSPRKVTANGSSSDSSEDTSSCSPPPDDVSIHRQSRGHREREPFSHDEAVSKLLSDDPNSVPGRSRRSREHRRPVRFEDFVCDAVKLCCD